MNAVLFPVLNQAQYHDDLSKNCDESSQVAQLTWILQFNLDGVLRSSVNALDDAILAKAASILLSLVVTGAAAALEARKGHCGGDNCARQVTGTRKGLIPLSSRKEDCSNFMRTTIVPDATTITVTVTVEPDEPVSLTKRGIEYRAATDVTNAAVPSYASSCKKEGKYASVCSCWGITPVLTTAPVPTETHTVTVTLDYCEDL
ncbi:hypothetical protein E4U21_002381 [Claviceps maximensis]|nr:hypothetical protein E4U21_002381 [Claviceps maximensis]